MTIIRHFFCENCRGHHYGEWKTEVCDICGNEWTDTREYEEAGITPEDLAESIRDRVGMTSDLSKESTGVDWGALVRD